MSGLRLWLMAARPRTLPAAIAPVLVGSTAAAWTTGGDAFRWGAFVAALIGSIFIQIGTNLANDYSDAKRGADTEDRLGPVRVTSSGLIAPRRVLHATWLAFAVAVVAGIYLATVAGWVIIVVGAASIAAGVLYTGGPRPYGYAGMGELFVFLFFGLVAVNGSYYVQLERLDWLPFWLSISVGLLSTAILVVNNVRDLETDRRADKRTLAVRLGRERTRVLYELCLGGAFVILAVGVAADGPAAALLGLLAAPLAYKPLQAVRTRTDGPALNGALAGTGALLGVFSLLVSAGLLIAASAMRLVEVEVVPYALPFERAYTTARGSLERREMLLLKLITDEGLVGLGEAVPLALRGGADLAAVERALRKGTRRLRRADLSDFAGAEPTLAAVDAYVHTAAGRRLPGPAKAAIEMAIFDLAGKASGRPLWSLLGAESASPVLCNATLVSGEPNAVADDAERWAARGFKTFKLKLGAGDDVAQVRAVRERLGPDARIRIDANGAWSADEALGVLRLIEPLGIELVEQPVADNAGMAAVTASTNVLVAADETVERVKDAARAKRQAACDLVTVKLSKVGGIGEANGIAGELPTYLSSALDGPVGIAAAAHAAQVLPATGPAAGIAHGLATQLLFNETIAGRECTLDEDRLAVPDGPGLGVELDEDALAAHRI